MTVENITKVIYDAIDDKLGKDIAILNIGAVSSLCDYFVIATASSQRQVKAIAEQKMPDLNAASLEAAMSMVAGTARSMGVVVAE